LLIVAINFVDDDSNANLQINFRGPKGYLTAAEYPLRNFYLVSFIKKRHFNLLKLDNVHRLHFFRADVVVFFVFELHRFASNSILDWRRHFRRHDRKSRQIRWVRQRQQKRQLDRRRWKVRRSRFGFQSNQAFQKCSIFQTKIQRAASRMLVIIVSLGFGVIKPRLGPMLHRIVGVGALYFILASIEAFIRVDSEFQDMGNRALILTEVF